MLTVLKSNIETYEVKKSKFISHLIPINQFDEYLKILRDEHQKANHIVWAYRRLNENGIIEERETDDGEPKNSSGKPTLRVLQGNNLVNVAILTVRYFGGIKLGVGGLVKAYTESAARVVKSAELIDLLAKEKRYFEIDIRKYDHFMYFIKKYKLSLIDNHFLGEKVKLTVEGNKKNLELLFNISKGFN